ncbi:nucleoside phosphorylase domain-containing protein [Aspergillus sergii]|uniref:Nucleoside phosphorylase domain-containing protein n=1 Tax=Aspergillus sergii TaxID=1034303 RepID=A0A5N6XKH3_9EURO|nr:nucleoside phosphorylase domain-containing protein [Aspergillus sergii]
MNRQTSESLRTMHMRKANRTCNDRIGNKGRPSLVLLNGFTQLETAMLMSVCGDKSRTRWNIVSWSKDDPCKHNPQTGEHTGDICAVLKRCYTYKTRLGISVRRDGTWTCGSTSTEDRMESNSPAPTLRLRDLLHGDGDLSGRAVAGRLLKNDKHNLPIALARYILCMLGTPMMHDGLRVKDIYIPYVIRALDHMSNGATLQPSGEEQINSREICVEKPILDAIAHCLNIYPQTQLDERMVRSVVYWNIVKPLQNYLDSLYTSRARASTLHRKRPADDMTSDKYMTKSEDFGSQACREEGPLALEPRPKRVKEDDPGPQSRKQEGRFCALYKELLAVRILFDCTHESIPVPPEDSNHYSFGRMGQHDIVAVCLPSGEYGTNSAADAIANMRRSFPAIRFCLLVGIGAGVPTAQNGLRLGDVVVSHSTGTHPGVIQYDLGKQGEDGVFYPTGSLQRPPRFLLTAISHLISNPDLSPAPLQGYVGQIIATRADYKHPDQENDTLFETGAVHVARNGIRGHQYADHEQQSRVPRRATYPHIHYGLIASGNRVMKSASARDHLASVYNTLCFEMEAAGVMNICPCLVIRGICDYAECNKNDLWQNYASATAAAYAKLFLTVVRPK